MKKNTQTLLVLNVLGLIAVIVLNYLSNSLPLNGRTPAQLSDLYPNYFVPAGLTFSIWGIIYSLIIGWGIMQIIALFNEKIRLRVEPAVQQIGYLFLFTCFFNMAWLFAWHWEQLVLSVVLMFGLFVSLILLNEKTAAGREKLNGRQKTLHATFTIYQGWISIALIANVTALLVGKNWQGWGIAPEMWATILIIIGTLVAIYMVFSRNQIFHGLVVIWALFGIYFKRNALNDAEMVKIAAIAGMIALLIAVAFRTKRWLSY
jgi:translocator protein